MTPPLHCSPQEPSTTEQDLATLQIAADALDGEVDTLITSLLTHVIKGVRQPQSREREWLKLVVSDLDYMLAEGRRCFDPWPLCVIDTETSGLREHPNARVVEFAAVVVDADGTELDHFHSLVRYRAPEPMPHYAQAAFAVHGIPLADLRDAPIPEEVTVAYQTWFAGLPKTPHVTAWRRAFDIHMLDRSRIDPYGSALRARCIQLAARECLGSSHPHLPYQPTLREAAEKLGIAVPAERHRALADARLAAAVAVRLETNHPGALWEA